MNSGSLINIFSFRIFLSSNHKPGLMKKLMYVFIILLLNSSLLFSQVAVSTDGSPPDSSSMLDVKSTSKGFLPPRMTLTQRTAITSPATGLLVFQTDAQPGLYYYTGTDWAIVAADSTPDHYIGERYGGGVVFWLDSAGQHGLICSMVDLSIQAWSNVASTLIGSTAQSDWNGLSNSNAIVGQAGHTSSAAQLCLNYTNADYGTGIYSDWYLPARTELNHLWNNIYDVQKALEGDGNPVTTLITQTLYWSSTENSSYLAYAFTFTEGKLTGGGKSTNYYVRAVRSF